MATWPPPESGDRMRAGTPEEVQERRGELVRCLFGLVMPGVDGKAAQLAGRPWSPDRLGVAVDVEVVVGRDEQQHRALDLAARGPRPGLANRGWRPKDRSMPRAGFLGPLTT